MTTPGEGSRPDAPLLDLERLFAGMRWRRRKWMTIGLIGLLLGVALAVFLPPAPTAVARMLVVHVNESPAPGTQSDVAVIETTRIAAAALKRLNIDQPPEQFLRKYTANGLTDNVVEITVRGSSDADAVVRAQALMETFIADHIQRANDAAAAEVKALTDRRATAERTLAEINAAGPAAAAAQSGRRTQLEAQIQDLGQRAEVAGIGAPRVAAGTQVVEPARAVTGSPLVAIALYAGVGLVLGLGIGLAVAAVGTVVKDRPVLRRDIANHLGASVIAQIPAPRRGPSRLWRRSRAVAERERVAGTLARAVRGAPGAVSLLELGCEPIAAVLAADIAEKLAAKGPVVVVDDLPGKHLNRLLAETESPIQLVDGAETAGQEPPPVGRRKGRIGVGSIEPGAAWMDLGRLGSETLLVVRAGHADTLWLHTIARQLADTEIVVIGVVLVHPDPRDRTDGTLWDALHVVLQGRAYPGERPVQGVLSAPGMPPARFPAPMRFPEPRRGAVPPRPTPTPRMRAQAGVSTQAIPLSDVRLPDMPTQLMPAHTPSTQAKPADKPSEQSGDKPGDKPAKKPSDGKPADGPHAEQPPAEPPPPASKPAPPPRTPAAPPSPTSPSTPRPAPPRRPSPMASVPARVTNGKPRELPPVVDGQPTEKLPRPPQRPGTNGEAR